MSQTATPTQLKPNTVKSFAAYIRDAEAAMEAALHGRGSFLWSDANSETLQRVRAGNIVAHFWAGPGPVKIPGGLIHDWIGAVFVEGVTVEDVLALVQNYENHKKIYEPDVMASRLISRQGNDFQIYLRLLKKKVVTVVLDTEHQVLYRSLEGKRWFCRSHTTRVAEVENAGTAQERVLDPDTGHGFLWRLCSYWRFQERDAGVYIECRAISLTRDVPFGLGWLIEPIIQELPKESLISTLEATRRAVLASVKQ